LPLEKETLSETGPLQGRRRLGGAYYIELGRIRPDPTQPRKKFDAHALDELAASVKRLGILQPIAVSYVESDGFYQIISGERRYLAAKHVGLTDIPCWVQTPKEEETLLRQISENWQRADLHPYDLADALARLRDAHGYSQKDLARETGKSEGEISKLLALLRLNPVAQREARGDITGALTKRHLYAVAKLPTEDQPAFVQAVKNQRLTAVETELAVAQKKTGRVGDKDRGPSLSGRRYVTSQATVTIKFRRKKVSDADVLVALEEVRHQIKQQDDEE